MVEFTASSGFAAAVASDVIQRTREYGGAHLTTWAEWVEPRVALMQELAIVIASRGDRDPLLAALSAFDGGRWEPTRRVERLFDGEILVAPEPSGPSLASEDAKRCADAVAKLPNANTLLHRLVAAYMADVVEKARQIRDRAASELAAMQPDARIETLEMRAAKAERATAQAEADANRARASEEHLIRENGLLKAELRLVAEMDGRPQDADAYVQAITLGLGNGGESASTESGAPEEPGAPLPSGIRQRGEDRYEALLYRSETHDNKQRGAGTFSTVEEAVTAREDALQREAELKAEQEQVAA